MAKKKTRKSTKKKTAKKTKRKTIKKPETQTKTEPVVQVPEIKTPCPKCGATETTCYETKKFDGVNDRAISYYDQEKRKLFPGRVRRRRRCYVCGLNFITNEGVEVNA